MGQQRTAKKAKRETRRNLREQNRIDHQRDNVTDIRDISASDFAHTIGMAKEKRDTSPIEARNVSQEVYLEAIERKSLVFASGDAGSGKTFISAALAADALLNKEVERIIVTRPVLSAEEDLGFLPGTIADKFAPFFRPVYDILRRRLGGSFLEYCLRPEIGKVEIAPFAYMRGRTFENAFIILDEAQNVTQKQMKLFLTRIGENCTVVVNGDVGQVDLPSHVPSGLADALTRFSPNSLVDVVSFGIDDCVRSDICKLALHAYSK